MTNDDNKRRYYNMERNIDEGYVVRLYFKNWRCADTDTNIGTNLY